MSELSDVEQFDAGLAAEFGVTPSWEQVTIVAPPEVTAAVIEFLGQRFGFEHIPGGIDWSVWERREDYAYADLAPCEPVTRNRYAVDWRKGQTRGDVVVMIELPEDRC